MKLDRVEIKNFRSIQDIGKNRDNTSLLGVRLGGRVLAGKGSPKTIRVRLPRHLCISTSNCIVLVF